MIHLLHDEEGLCGATLLPMDTPVADWDWTEQREDATCPDCIEIHDERAWDREQEASSGWTYSAADYAADRAVEISRGIE